MSKQVTRKAGSNSPAKPAAKPAATKPGAAKPAAGKNNRPISAQTAARPRPSGITARPRQAPRRSGGFRLRPLDIAIIAIGVVVVGLIVWLGLSGGTKPPAQVANPNGPAVGQAAPDFSLPDPSNKTYSLSQFKGKVVLLEFFAPWCPHCQNDAPMLNKVYNDYKSKGVEFLAVSATPYDRNFENVASAGGTPTPISMSDIAWFRDTFTVTYPMLFDASASIGTQQYGVQGYPTVYILDKNGNVTAKPDYPFTEDTLRSDLDQALKQQ